MTDTASQNHAPPAAPSPSDPFDPVIDLDAPYIRFCGRISNIPPDAAEVVLSEDARRGNTAIQVEGWPDLYEMVAKAGEIFGRLTLTHGVTKMTRVARLMMPQPGRRAVVLLSDEQEQQLTDLWFRRPPGRLPAGLRALSADLAADQTSPLPADLRTTFSRTAKLFADVIEQFEEALELPCGTVGIRIEAITFAGHVDVLTRSIRAGHALLDDEITSLRGGAEGAMMALGRMLDVLTQTLATPQKTVAIREETMGVEAPSLEGGPAAAAEQPPDPV